MIFTKVALIILKLKEIYLAMHFCKNIGVLIKYEI